MDYKLVGIIEQLEADRTLSDNQLLELIAGMKNADKDTEEMLYHSKAEALRKGCVYPWSYRVQQLL